MDRSAESKRRKRIYEDSAYPWHIGRLPATEIIDGKTVKSLSHRCAVFVVHGIGTQTLSETAAALRSGFDDVLDYIAESEADRTGAKLEDQPRKGPNWPPYIMDGYWGNYDDVEATFPEDWNKLDTGARLFFKKLWRIRLFSSFGTFFWFLGQQWRLLSPAKGSNMGVFTWLLYLPFQFIFTIVLFLLVIFKRSILNGYLEDVRLYVAPHGITDRAIAQRIDKRVAEQFMKLIGLDLDFWPLPEEKQYHSTGEPLVFDRVVWVAHSLGTVISYNALSDLFWKADRIMTAAKRGEHVYDEQIKGVQKFRDSLRRFVTMGSPLDKVCFMYGEDVLSPWPSPRKDLVTGGERDLDEEWWVNFYTMLDPVAGALDNEMITGGVPPINEHIQYFHWPIAAHMAYWRDQEVLSYILSRTFGKQELPYEIKIRRNALLAGIVAFVLYWVILFAMIAVIGLGVWYKWSKL